MFEKKILQVEVVEGVDLEERRYLTGTRVSVGSGTQDDFRLGGAQVVPEHVVFARTENGKGWEYFTSGTGEVEIDKGNPRTGAVRPGMWIRLGPETRLRVTRVTAPPELKTAAESEESKEIPLTVAIPVMLVCLVAFGWYINMISGGGDADDGELATEAWYRGAPSFDRALDICLESAGPATADRVPATAPDADYRAYSAAVGSDTEAAAARREGLAARLRGLLTETHLLVREGEYANASDTLARIERILPVQDADCPILSFARRDVAALDRRRRR